MPSGRPKLASVAKPSGTESVLTSLTAHKVVASHALEMSDQPSPPLEASQAVQAGTRAKIRSESVAAGPSWKRQWLFHQQRRRARQCQHLLLPLQYLRLARPTLRRQSLSLRSSCPLPCP